MSKGIHSPEVKAELEATIGRHARRARHALRLTQAQIAQRIGISAEFYARVERGQALPSIETLARMVTVLGISADELLGLDEEEERQPKAPKLPPNIAYVVDRARNNEQTLKLINALLRHPNTRK